MKIDFIKLIISIVACQAAGVIGSVFTTSSIPTWYAALTKPSFNPPNWVFAPVWTTLFLLMGVSLYLVWQAGFEKPEVKIAIYIFSIQLILNIAWSLLFFGLKIPLIAFIEIIVLWIAILFTIIKFYNISIIASLLLVPYLFWVSFAAVLNFFLWRLNS